MADATTFTPPAYTPPADFAGRTAQIANAYKDALAKTQLQRSNLYTNAGFQDGTTNIDPGNAFGGIQQLLHSEGQALSADDQNARHRGLQADSGLGAQGQRADRYAEHLGASNIGNQLLQGVSDLGNQDVASLHQRQADDQSNGFDEATYNAGQNAYNDALAQYLKMVGANQPGGTPANSPTPFSEASPSSFLSPANIAKAASKSMKSTVGKQGNSGIHAN